MFEYLAIDFVMLDSLCGRLEFTKIYVREGIREGVIGEVVEFLYC